jgi:hypothetical protein
MDPDNRYGVSENECRNFDASEFSHHAGSLPGCSSAIVRIPKLLEGTLTTITTPDDARRCQN